MSLDLSRVNSYDKQLNSIQPQTFMSADDQKTFAGYGSFPRGHLYEAPDHQHLVQIDPDDLKQWPSSFPRPPQGYRKLSLQEVYDLAQAQIRNSKTFYEHRMDPYGLADVAKAKIAAQALSWALIDEQTDSLAEKCAQIFTTTLKQKARELDSIFGSKLSKLDRR